MSAKIDDLPLQQLLARIETWPKSAQEELVRSALDIEMRYLGSYELTESDRLALERSLDDVRQGRLATEEQVAAAFRRPPRS